MFWNKVILIPPNRPYTLYMKDSYMNNSNLSDVELLEQFNSLIQSMAEVAYKKIKKPSQYSRTDLYQEGNIAVLEAYHRWWNPNKGTALKTFLTLCLRTAYTDIVRASYRDSFDNTKEFRKQEKEKYRKEEKSHIVQIELEDLISCRLNKREKQYVETFLSVCKTEKFPRSEVQKRLNLTYSQEAVIRKSIRIKFNKE